MFNYLDKKIDQHILMKYSTQKNYVSMAKEFQKHLSNEHHKHGVIDQGKYKKYPVKESGKTESIMFRIMMMLFIYFLLERPKWPHIMIIIG